MEGNLRFKIDWASLTIGSKFIVFALFHFVFEDNFPSTSPRGAYIWRDDLTEGFLRYRFGGACFRNFTIHEASKRQQFAAFVKQTGKVQKENTDFQASHAEMRKCSYVLNLKDNFGKVEKWLIVQQIGFDNEVGTRIADGSVNGYLRLLPRGGVACLLLDVSTDSESLRRGHKAYWPSPTH